MADVTIKYKGSKVAELSASGTKTLKTSGKYCEGNVEVSYSPPAMSEPVNCKIYEVNVPTAVAAQYVTLVSGDPDVAAHYADETAMVTIRKVTNNTSNGTAIICHTNHEFGTTYGSYMNFNGTANAAATFSFPLSSTGSNTSVPHARCDANGNIKAYAVRQQNNFGGADYIVTFSW